MNTVNINVLTPSKQATCNNDPIKSTKEKEHLSKYKKPHVIIPTEDLTWALNQKPSVSKLWQECWVADAFGSRWMQLNTSLKRSAFMEAKKVLENKGLFIFKTEKSVRDNRETICWMVKNLHGSRIKEYWDSESIDSNSIATDANTTSTDIDTTPQNELSMKMDLESAKMDTTSINMDTTSAKMDSKSAYTDSIYTETLTQQASQKRSRTSHEHLSNSSKELLGCKNNFFASAKEEINQECPTTSLNMPKVSKASPLSDQELLRWLKSAETGMIPPQEVIDQMRDSPRYWTAFVACARKHQWDLRASSTSFTPVSSMLEKLKELQKSRQE